MQAQKLTGPASAVAKFDKIQIAIRGTDDWRTFLQILDTSFITLP